MLIYSIIIPVKNMYSSSTQIIVNNNLSSTVKIRYNKYSINSTIFPKNIISQLIGHLLGDGSIIFSKTSINPYFVFTQTAKRSIYTWHIFTTLSHYCFRFPKYYYTSRNFKYVPFFQVFTRSYLFF